VDALAKRNKTFQLPFSFQKKSAFLRTVYPVFRNFGLPVTDACQAIGLLQNGASPIFHKKTAGPLFKTGEMAWAAAGSGCGTHGFLAGPLHGVFYA